MSEDLGRQVRIAARALGRAGLVHAYGHCSARLDAASFLVCPSVPMALVRPGDPCTTVPVAGPLPAGVLGEVRIHQRVYASRPDTGGVVRFMGPNVMALGALGRVPRMRHGFGAYFHPGIGFWPDVQLVRSDEAADGVAAAIGAGNAVVMQGNGAVVFGAGIAEAVMLAWYFEDACRIELAALAAGAGDGPLIGDEDARRRATRQGGIVERMWDYLTHGDPERSDD